MLSSGPEGSTDFVRADLRAPITPRGRAQVAGFFDGLDLQGPGLTTIDAWRPEWQADLGMPGGLAGYCGMGRKP